jgi:hypothetical protein
MKPSLFNDFLFGLHLNNVPDWFFIDAAAVPINYKYKDAASMSIVFENKITDTASLTK